MPAYSPDINIIEPVWNEMKKFVHKVPCYTVAALIQRILKSLSTLTAERCSRYVHHFRNVMQEVILRQGAWTDM